jgi:hypothetical protein
VHYGIPDLFSYSGDKLPWISFMPRKNVEEVRQVVNILKFRDVLDEIEEVIGLWKKDKDELLGKGKMASDFVKENYSQDREAKDM